MKLLESQRRFCNINKDKIFKELENSTALICVYIDNDNVYRLIHDGMNSMQAFYSIEKMRDWVSCEAFHKEDNDCE